MNQVTNERSGQIADFLGRRLTFLPSPGRQFRGWNEFVTVELPTVENFATALVQDAEFRSLQLGTWLGTTNGEIIEEAVGMVIAPVYAPEYELAVNGLKLAARIQQQEGTQAAGKFLLIVFGAGLITAGIASIGRSAA
jgi:hypothetical protein